MSERVDPVLTEHADRGIEQVITPGGHTGILL
jgi:hypothetical protein